MVSNLSNYDTLIISDTHFDSVFDIKRARYLKSLTSGFKTIIINGDLYEGYKVSGKSFIKTWGDFFTRISKDKEIIYLIGNHDSKALLQKDITKVFKTIDKKYTLYLPNSKIKITHRESKNISIDIKYGIQKFPIYLSRILLSINRYEHKQIQLATKRLNEIKYVKNETVFNIKDIKCIYSHSHKPKVNISKKTVNTGFINYGFSSYVAIDSLNGTAKLVKEPYL